MLNKLSFFMEVSVNLRRIIMIMAGSFILAFGIYNVHSISGVTEGGVLGLILLLEHWFRISPSISSFVLNTLCFMMGLKVLGKSFIIYSLMAGGSFSVFYGILERFPRLFMGIVNYPLLAAISGAIFVGVGAGLCVKAGAAQGGDDAIAMVVNKVFNIPIEKVYLFSDIVVLLLSLSYIPLARIIYSLITVIISGQIIGYIQRKEI